MTGLNHNLESEIIKAENDDEVRYVARQHPLQNTYCIWFSTRKSGNPKIIEDFYCVGSISTVEEFWALYSHLKKPTGFNQPSDYYLFKKGIMPVEKEEVNINGGKWILRLKQGFASRCWENLILAILGEQFQDGDEICGAVLSIRYSEHIIALWTRSADNEEKKTRIYETLQKVLDLSSTTIMDYKAHDIKSDNLNNPSIDINH